MEFLIATGWLIVAFAAMELAAWSAHKYLMHGPLWFLHKDHHNHQPGFFERNDWFFVLFTIPSWLLIMFGMMNGTDYRVWLGLGIALYGLVYFLVHDVFIHQRFKLLRKSDHPYLMAIRKAHKVHHKKRDRLDGSCFGMLVVPWKFYQEAKQSQSRIKGA